MGIRVYLNSGKVFKLDHNYWEVIHNYNLCENKDGWLFYYYLLTREEDFDFYLLKNIISIIDNWDNNLIDNIY
jgi:hypothetical protein